ncbi:MAG: hypothetical protein V3S69_01700 [Dehalococcoidales bacterium]
MSTPIICLDNINSSFAASGDTPTDEQSFPHENATDYTHPLRQFRTGNDAANGNQLKLENTSGASVTVGAVLIDNVNIDIIRCEPPTQASNATTVVDSRTGRRKAVFIFSSGVAIADGATLTIEVASGGASTPDINETHIGGVSIWSYAGTYDFPGAGIQGLEWSVTNPQAVNTYSGGVTEPIDIGEPFVTLKTPQLNYLPEVTDSGQSANQMAILSEIIRRGAAPVLFYENNGNIEKAYNMRLLASKPIKTIDRLTDQVTAVSLTFVETI